MEIRRTNNIIDSECDNGTIYELSVSYSSGIFSDSIPYIEIEYDSALDMKILDTITTSYGNIKYFSRNRDSLKLQEKKMLSLLRKQLLDSILEYKNEINSMNKKIIDLEDGTQTLTFREHKLKRILEDL